MKLRDVLVHQSNVFFEFDRSLEAMEIKSIASPRVEFDGDDDEPQFSNLRSGMLPPQNAMEVKGTEWYKTCYQTHPSRQRRMRKAHTKDKKSLTKAVKKKKKVRTKIKSYHWENVFLNRHKQTKKEIVHRCTYEVKRSKIFKEKALVPTSEHEKVLQVLIKHYHHIEEIFMFGCAVDGQSPTNIMTELEFKLFCEHTGIKERNDMSMNQELEYIFMKTNVEKDENGKIIRSSKANSAKQLLRFEFLEALVRLSKLVMKNRDDISVSEDEEEATLGEGMKIAKILDRFLNEYIEPVACDYHEETQNLRKALIEQETLKVYHDHRKRFEKVFNAYTKREDGGMQKVHVGYDKDQLSTLDIGEFLLLLRELNLLKKNTT